MEFFFFCLGLIFGSFFNVVIYRLPRGLSLIKPRSHCPHCGQVLSFAELIPLVSFLLQKGRCQTCGASISWRYFLVELVSGLGFLLVYWRSPSFPDLVAGLAFFSLLLILAFIDLEHHLLLNSLTIPGLVLGLAFSIRGWPLSFFSASVGAALGFLIIVLIILLSRGGMGMGDAKLMAMIGAFLGGPQVLLVLFGGSLIGSIAGIFYLWKTKQGPKTPIPFGPSLAMAAFIVYLWPHPFPFL